MTKFEKETRHRLYVFTKTTVNSAKCASCPLTQARRANCPFNCPITLSTYRHDAMTRTRSYAQIGLVITNHVREFVIVLINI